MTCDLRVTKARLGLDQINKHKQFLKKKPQRIKSENKITAISIILT